MVVVTAVPFAIVVVMMTIVLMMVMVTVMVVIPVLVIIMVVTMAWRQCWWWCLVTVTVSAIPYVTWPLAPSPPCIPTDTTRRGARPGYKLWRTFNLLPGLHSTYKTRTLTLTGALFIRDFPLTH